MTFSRKLIMAVILILLLAAAVFPALLAGQYSIEPGQVWALIWSKVTGIPNPDVGLAQEVIIWKIRLPRLVLAVTTGMALAVSGAAYQGCFRNPLVEPYILGCVNIIG